MPNSNGRSVGELFSHCWPSNWFLICLFYLKNSFAVAVAAAAGSSSSRPMKRSFQCFHSRTRCIGFMCQWDCFCLFVFFSFSEPKTQRELGYAMIPLITWNPLAFREGEKHFNNFYISLMRETLSIGYFFNFLYFFFPFMFRFICCCARDINRW